MTVFERDTLFIGGRWVAPSTPARLEVQSPSTEAIVGRVPAGAPEDVDKAVAAARLAFDQGPWRTMSVEERIPFLERVVDGLEKRREEIIDLQIDEMGGTRVFHTMNLNAIPGFLARMVYDCGFVRWREVRDGTVGKVVVVRQPVGVVGAVIPWNAPVMVAVSKLFPSLLMGCPMVIKPAPESSLSAFLLAEAVEEAGIPEGVVSVVAGDVSIGASLVAHPDVDMITFTGSSAGGQAIAAKCGELLRPVTLELGGKSAAIVLEGVDMRDHLPQLVGNSLRNSGQICISTNRILVHRSQRDEFTEQLVEYVAAMKVGDPHEPDTDFGPVAAARQRDRVEGYIASGTEEGAKIVLGGSRPAGFEKGWYVEPTIFVDVDNDMRIAREEIFGPVLSVLTYDTEEEAIAIANDSEYGLGGAVFGDDVDHALEVASRIDTGTCAINEAPPSGGGGPFGGLKRSGLGYERGPEGLESFLETKSISLPAGFDPSTS
jgi:aldehyde dehydrogenase (NAD+)